MEPDIALTREALEICTPEQLRAIKTLAHKGTKMRVFIDFSLPTGHLYFTRATQGDLYQNISTLHGGIDPEGSIST